MSVNRVTLLGNVGADPTIRDAAGTMVAHFRVATTERWKDKGSGESKEATEWHTVNAWRGLAKIVGDRVRKGDKVYVEGKLKTRKYTDGQGVERFTTEVEANAVEVFAAKAATQTAADQ